MQQCIKPTDEHDGGNIRSGEGPPTPEFVISTGSTTHWLKRILLCSAEAWHPFWLKVEWKRNNPNYSSK